MTVEGLYDCSILNSIKKILGIMPDCDSFDLDILTCINSSFVNLSQLGVEELEGVVINDAKTTYSDIFYSDSFASLVSTYLAHKARLFFDPPTSSIILENIKELIKEEEFRIMMELTTRKGGKKETCQR